MPKTIGYFFLFFIVAACVEPYHFVIPDATPSLVVEAYLSDKSYKETLTYPSDGRFFTVKLSYTSDVINTPSQEVSLAVVELHSDRNEVWKYTELTDTPGLYGLLDSLFEAEAGVRYKLHIQLPDEEIYESEWEGLPTTEPPPMGTVGFEEIMIKKYAIEANEEVVVSVKGIGTVIDIPEHTAEVPLYYKWSFVPHWMYIAPLSPSVVLPGHTCWATTPYYLRNFAIQRDLSGGYKKSLFSMETVRNDRIFQKFSTLIIQYAMTEPYFNFWEEMREQNQEASLVDKPPFNLATNIHSITSEKRVNGYFGVVYEQATRWYFTKKELSYFVENTLKEDCLKSYGGPPAPECLDCRQYSKADATNVKPWWWVD